ncbi:MAG: ribokinase [Planctomycetota bacterium]|nr:MAG: ribokinase [Planctomycetota bacterium]REJ89830.1 MAG: ribokinase [Planctomycetota bacterium]
MTAKPITVLGSINVDLVVRSKRLPAAGETVTGGAFYQASGGKGANKAVAAARLSCNSARQAAADSPVQLVGAVGDDELGRWVCDQLGREPLDDKHIRTLAEHATGIALIMVDAAGENLISVASGANAALSVADVNALDEDLFAGVFVANLELTLCTVARGLKRAQDRSATTLLNPAPAHAGLLENNVLKQVDVLTPNEIEAEHLTGLSVTTTDEAIAAARRLQQLGCGSCVITRGAAGAIVVDADDRVTEVPAVEVEAVDTTAAGDAFNGALAVALAEGRDLVEAAHWASRAAALSVTRRGAQPSLPWRAEVEAAFS